jgi:hypothetical protein
MLTIKKINDRKTANTDVVIRMTFREALRLQHIMNTLATNEALEKLHENNGAFGLALKADLNKLLDE